VDARPAERRVSDRRGNLLALLRWAPDRLDAAWLRIPDGGWVAIEPRATTTAPWGLSDRLSLAAGPGETGRFLSIFEAVDYTRVTRIPTLAEPAALPAGAGGAVLNLLATLAAEQGRTRLIYAGPYPTEQLFLTLLESFRYEAAPGDPLAAFMAGGLAWSPAPHQRFVTPEGLYVQHRDLIEKVVWRGRTYLTPDWQGVKRHAPRRVVATGPLTADCGLWALGDLVERHLQIRSDGAVHILDSPPPDDEGSRPLPAVVVDGVAAVIAATGAPPLRPFVGDAVRELGLAWAAVRGDLIDAAARPLRLSSRLRARGADLLAKARTRDERAALGLAALTEMAMLAADAVRARAQARLAALPEDAQTAALTSPPPLDPAAAREITDAVATLLTDLE
jgi:hypothetical protein